jgi:hypothetical protein
LNHLEETSGGLVRPARGWKIRWKIVGGLGPRKTNKTGLGGLLVFKNNFTKYEGGIFLLRALGCLKEHFPGFSGCHWNIKGDFVYLRRVTNSPCCLTALNAIKQNTKCCKQ